jgi:hypothetical protein
VLGLAFMAASSLLVLGLLVRFGALAVIVTAFVMNTLWFPINLDPSVSYGHSGLLVLTLIVGLAAYGFHTATGARRPARGGAP